MDEDDTWFADPPEEIASKERAAMAAWVREHPSEFWYHVAVILYRSLAKRRKSEPEGWKLGIPWRYLVEYPYGCLEQTLSRFVPLAKAKDLSASLGFASLDGTRADAFIKANGGKQATFDDALKAAEAEHGEKAQGKKPQEHKGHGEHKM